MAKTLIWPLLGVCLLAATLRVAADEPRGHLVLNGGGAKPDVVMEKFVELAGGPDALIVVFPTASGEPDTGDYYRDLFGEYGCTKVVVADVRTNDDAEDSALAARVREAGGILARMLADFFERLGLLW